jgi:hypothetical protein
MKVMMIKVSRRRDTPKQSPGHKARFHDWDLA